MRYFLGIMGILRFFHFLIFPNHRNTLMLQSCTLCFHTSEKILSYHRGCRHYWLNYVKTHVHLYVDFFIFVFLNLYFHASKLP